MPPTLLTVIYLYINWKRVCRPVWFHFQTGSKLTFRTDGLYVHRKLHLELCVKYGVRKGSVLGPPLFSLNEPQLVHLIKKKTKINDHNYADDSQRYASIQFSVSDQ